MSSISSLVSIFLSLFQALGSWGVVLFVTRPQLLETTKSLEHALLYD